MCAGRASSARRIRRAAHRSTSGTCSAPGVTGTGGVVSVPAARIRHHAGTGFTGSHARVGARDLAAIDISDERAARGGDKNAERGQR